jgi:hypothetical protein
VDPALADQIRAYEIRLARTEARPALHAHLRAALAGHLAIARQSADGVDLLARLRAAGCATTVANAPYLDRQAALARVHTALGDPARAAMHEQAARDVAAAGDAQAVKTMIACERRVLGFAMARDAAGEAAGGIAMALVDARADRDRAEKERYVAAMRGSLGVPLGDLFDAPWLRARLPFDRARWDELASWASAEPSDVHVHVPVLVPEETEAENIPEAPPAPLVDGYRAQLAWADPARKAVLDQIVAMAGVPDTTVMRRMAELDLELALARATPLAQAEAGLARALARGQPHAAAHFRVRIAALRAAATVTELEAELAWDDACFAVEATWWTVLVHVAAHGTAAAADHERLGTPDSQRAVAAAQATTVALLGTSAGDLLAMPWMRPFVEGILWASGDVVDLPVDALIASHGETGYTALAPLRAAAAAALSREAASGIADPADFMARLRRPRAPDAAAFVARNRGLLGAGPPADPARRVVHLWGHTLDLAALHEADLVALRPRP